MHFAAFALHPKSLGMLRDRIQVCSNNGFSFGCFIIANLDLFVITETFAPALSPFLLLVVRTMLGNLVEGWSALLVIAEYSSQLSS